MLGRYLRRLSFYLFLSFVALLTATAKDRSGSIPSANGTVRFDLYRGYLIVARGSVGSLKGLNFLVDTGTSTTLIDARVAGKLKLDGDPEEVNIMFFERRVQAMHAHAPSIELGPIRKSRVPVLVQDLSMFDDGLPVRIDAVVGLDVLSSSPFEVDYRHRRIYFGKLPRLPISVPLCMEDGLALVDVEVNHTTAHLIIDTGTPVLLIFAARIPKAIAGLKVHRPRNGGNSADRQVVHLPHLQLGRAEFIRQQALVMENCDEGGRDFDGLLSPAALGIDAFTVDIDRGALEMRIGM